MTSFSDNSVTTTRSRIRFWYACMMSHHWSAISNCSFASSGMLAAMLSLLASLVYMYTGQWQCSVSRCCWYMEWSEMHGFLYKPTPRRSHFREAWLPVQTYTTPITFQRSMASCTNLHHKLALITFQGFCRFQYASCAHNSLLHVCTCSAHI